MKFSSSLLVLVSSVLVVFGLHHIPLTPHHVLVRDHQQSEDEAPQAGDSLRARRTTAQQVDAAYQGYGTHYVDIWTGTPPQRQTVIIGTGSGGIGFPCSNCLDCGTGSSHTDPFFRETESLTFQTIHCGFCEVGKCNTHEVNDPHAKCTKGVAYQEGSMWSGFEAKDMAYVGGPHDKALAKGAGADEGHDDIDPDQAREYQFLLDFICQTKATGLFKTQLADGILGMDNSPNAYWHQALRANISDTAMFSLCFARQPTASREGTEAGAFTLGGFDQRLHNDDSKVVYAEYDTKQSFFFVDLKGIYLRKGGGGESALSKDNSIPIVELAIDEATLNKGGVIIDSGTTDTYLPRHFQVDFLRAWAEMTDKPYHHMPLTLTEEELHQLPTIMFQLKGHYSSNSQLGSNPYPLGTLGSAVPNATRPPQDNFDIVVAMPPSHYMQYQDGFYTNRLYMEEAWGSVLGANFMMGHDISFDTDEGRIGFAESACDYLRLLDEFNEPNPWEDPASGSTGGGSTLSPQGNDDKPQYIPKDDDSAEGGNPTGGSGAPPESGKKSGGISGTGVLVVFLLTATVGIGGALYGKKIYNRRFGGFNHYEPTSMENELELQESTIGDENTGGTYASPSFTIS